MPRKMPATAEQKRRKAAVETRMSQGPVQRIFDKLLTFSEDVRGLNVSGAQSGRIAKAKAIKKYQKSLPKTEKYAP